MEVTLRRPAPLDYPVRVTRLGGDEVIFKADGTLIAETHLATLTLMCLSAIVSQVGKLCAGGKAAWIEPKSS